MVADTTEGIVSIVDPKFKQNDIVTLKEGIRVSGPENALFTVRANLSCQIITTYYNKNDTIHEYVVSYSCIKCRSN